MLQRARLIVIDGSTCAANVIWKREKRSVMYKKVTALFSVSRSEAFVEMSVWDVFSVCSVVSVETVVFATEVTPVCRCGLGAFGFCIILPLNSN